MSDFMTTDVQKQPTQLLSQKNKADVRQHPKF
jgi:hypothetical protein